MHRAQFESNLNLTGWKTSCLRAAWRTKWWTQRFSADASNLSWTSPALLAKVSMMSSIQRKKCFVLGFFFFEPTHHSFFFLSNRPWWTSIYQSTDCNYPQPPAWKRLRKSFHGWSSARTIVHVIGRMDALALWKFYPYLYTFHLTTSNLLIFSTSSPSITVAILFLLEHTVWWSEDTIPSVPWIFRRLTEYI